MIMTKTRPDYFFGSMSRPLMIGASEAFTYFDLVFCETVGLCVDDDVLPRFEGLVMRTPAEVKRVAQWLREAADEHQQSKGPEGIFLKRGFCHAGFSPEFEEENHFDESGVLKYDATDLSMSISIVHNEECSWLYMEDAGSFEETCTQPIPLEEVPAFANALTRFAEIWETDGIDLTKEQPITQRL